MLQALRALSRRVQTSLTRQILSDPDALSILLHTLRDAEAGGESLVFRNPCTILPPRLERLVARHAADEERHFELLDRALRHLGNPQVETRHVQVLAVVEGLAGDVFRRDLDQPENLAAAYWMIYALERRLAAFLANLTAALGDDDPVLADILGRIRSDEERHITWCQVITWEVQRGDRVAWEAAREHAVALEARGFALVQATNLKTILRSSLRAMPWPQRAAWWLAASALQWSGLPLPVGDPEGRIEQREWRPWQAAEPQVSVSVSAVPSS